MGHQQAVRADAYRLLMPPGNGCPLHVPIADDNPIYGFVQCEVLRSVDLGARERGGACWSGLARWMTCRLRVCSQTSWWFLVRKDLANIVRCRERFLPCMPVSFCQPSANFDRYARSGSLDNKSARCPCDHRALCSRTSVAAFRLTPCRPSSTCRSSWDRCRWPRSCPAATGSPASRSPSARRCS